MFSDLLEGETPLDDLSGLIPEYITSREELNIAEMTNISYASQKYLLNPTFKYDQKYLFDIHKDMFNNVWSWAGIKRKTNLNIGVHYLNIDIEIKKGLDDLKYWEEETLPPIEIISLLHHRLVKIHPFLNGNGRWARVVSKIYAKSCFNLDLMWPEADYIKESGYRKLYITALKKADNLDFDELIHIHKSCILLKENPI